MIEAQATAPEDVAASVERVVPPSLVPLFDGRFTRSHLLFDEYIFRLTLDVVARAGLDECLADGGSVEGVVARAHLDAQCSTVPIGWMFRRLAARGVLARHTDGRFRAKDALPALDPQPVRAEQRAHDPASLPSYALADAAAADYPAFLRGERRGEDILLAPARMPLWVAYFSNENILYAINNLVGAVALEAWMPAEPTTILELGGGLGSGATAALDRLAEAGRLPALRAYRFTELVPAFLRRGQRLLQQRPEPISFDALDMNRPFAEQGVAPGSVSVVYAVNTLHVAHDLVFTLDQVRRALGPHGQLVISECIRPWDGHTVYPEFVFNLLETFRAPKLDPTNRPNGGFLTPEQWTSVLTVAGFDDIRMLPDITRVRQVFPSFYVAAIGARRSD